MSEENLPQLVTFGPEYLRQAKTQEQAIREAQDFFATLAPPDVLLSEELIRERREEASRE